MEDVKAMLFPLLGLWLAAVLLILSTRPAGPKTGGKKLKKNKRKKMYLKY